MTKKEKEAMDLLDKAIDNAIVEMNELLSTIQKSNSKWKRQD